MDERNRLRDRQRARMNAQFRVLRDETIFPPEKRSMASGTRYLIMGYGGTGCEALYETKRAFNRLLENDYKDKVKFLAIDTDRSWNETAQEDEYGNKINKFSAEEMFCLDATAAVNDAIVHPEHYSDWMNPDLPSVLRNDVLNRAGAGGYRQCGRLALSHADTVNTLQARVLAHVNALMAGTADNLKVMVITGISGGTGSGTFIDLTYLIKDIIAQNTAGNINDRTTFCGFVLLPQTGNSEIQTVKDKGNANGYAAFKELNRFMTIEGHKGEYYEATFGGRKIKTNERIFKTCYLIDGVRNGITTNNPRGEAMTAISQCLIDMVSSSPVNANNGGTAGGAAQVRQTVDAFMVDVFRDTQTMLQKQRAVDAPRDADYIYCALGYSETLIPINEMKAYVAKRLFDGMYAKYKNAGNVTGDDAKNFVKDVYLRDGGRRAQREKIESEVKRLFREPSKGPYYVVNLLRDASDYAETQIGKGLFPNRQKDDKYRFIGNCCAELNVTTFNVFTTVIEEMKNLLEEQYGIIVDTTRSTHNYSFMPIDLSKLEGPSWTVRKYLDALVDPKRVGELKNKLLDEMIDNMDVWSQVIREDESVGAFNAAKAIRDFWERELNKIINSTLEDYLIKYYSENPDAKYDENDPAGSMRDLEQAARKICEEMYGAAGRAQPLIDFTNKGISSTALNTKKFMMIPTTATHLREAVKRELATNQYGNTKDITVFESLANDKISCYTQYNNVPPFKLRWACTGEKAYEACLHGANAAGIGLHMSETMDGRDWRDFPNLIPVSAWELANDNNYSNEDEANISNKAIELFERAKAVGLIASMPAQVGSNHNRYTVQLLPADKCIDIALIKKLEHLSRGGRSAESAAVENTISEKTEALAQTLYNMNSTDKKKWASSDPISVITELQEQVRMDTAELYTIQTVYSEGEKIAATVEWDETIAKQMLRTMPDTMNALQATLPVIERLQQLVAEEEKKAKRIVDFAKYLTADLFQYNEELYQWEYNDGGGWCAFCELKPGDKFEKLIEEYLMYGKFSEFNEYAFEILEGDYEAATNDPDRTIAVQKQFAVSEKAKIHIARIENMIEPTKYNAPENITTTGFAAKATLRNYDVEEIRAFYSQLAVQLGLLP